MVMSWIRSGLMVGFAAFGLLLLHSLFAEGPAHLRDVVFAGGFYTVAFALRVSD